MGRNTIFLQPIETLTSFEPPKTIPIQLLPLHHSTKTFTGTIVHEIQESCVLKKLFLSTFYLPTTDPRFFYEDHCL